MYSSKPQGWAKNLDYIILDILCLHVAFVLAYITWHGFRNPYAEGLYRNMAFVYTAVDFVVLITKSTMKNVLKRGFYKEILRTGKHVFLVAVVISAFLFSVQRAEAYSRITFYLTAGYYGLISYLIRGLWKRFLRKKKKNSPSTAVYIVTMSPRAEEVIDNFERNNMGIHKIQGLRLLDRDKRGETVCGVSVTASRESLVDYLCDKWVDEVFFSLPVSAAYPAELFWKRTLGLHKVEFSPIQ